MLRNYKRVYIKRTWQLCQNKEILKIFEEVKEEAKRLYPCWFEGNDPKLYVNISMKSLGQFFSQPLMTYCYKSELSSDFNANKIRYNDAVIVISKYICSDLDQVRKTLVHEFGHYVSYSDNHGYYWKVRSDNIGKKWDIKCTRLAKTSLFDNARQIKSPEKKYILRCPKCNKILRRYATPCLRWRNEDLAYHVGCNATLVSEIEE